MRCPRAHASRHLGPDRAADRHADPVRRQDRVRTNLVGMTAEQIEDDVNERLVAELPGEGRPGRPGASCARPSASSCCNVIDDQWKDHLLSMDHLKEGIGLRGYGQKDPLVEYKKESFDLFQDMMDRIEDETIRYLFFLQVHRRRARRQWTRARSPVLPSRPMGRRARKRKKTKRHRSRASSRAAPRRAIRRPGLDAEYPAQEGKGTGRTAIRGRRRHGHRKETGRHQRKRRPQRSLPVRQRKKIQEMSRSFLAALLLDRAPSQPFGRRNSAHTNGNRPNRPHPARTPASKPRKMASRKPRSPTMVPSQSKPSALRTPPALTLPRSIPPIA